MPSPKEKVPPIQLRAHFYPRIHVVAAENPPKKKPSARNDCPVDVDVSLARHEEKPEMFQVSLSITTPEKRAAECGYSLDIKAVGYVEVDKNHQKEAPRLAGTLGASVLYSAAREFIFSLTLRSGPWGGVYLPTWSFLAPTGEMPPDEDAPKQMKPERQSKKDREKASAQ
jgi:preprotein translocase subunit SecB